MKDTLKKLQFAIGLLDKFSDEEMDALINNEASLKIIYCKKDNSKKLCLNKKSKEALDIESICKKIDSFNSREEATNYLEDKKFNKAELREIAKYYNISIITRDTNSKLIYKIVDGVVGAKIKFNALLNTNI